LIVLALFLVELYSPDSAGVREIYVCMCVFVDEIVCLTKSVCVSVCVSARVCICMYVCVYAFLHIYIHVYIYLYI